MRKFYLSLIRQRDHLVFLFAIVISFSLILSNDSTDVAIFRGKANDLLTSIYKPVSWLRAMAVVDEEAALIREENIIYSLQLESMRNLAIENQRLREMLNYKRESQLQLLPAKVINKGITSNMNTLTIDVGNQHGIKKNMSVITPKGVVGKTIVVGNQSSVVQILNDVNFRLSVQVMPSGARGILRWVYGDLCEIREIQKNSEVKIGDQVITSGFSDIFPKNLPVGEVIGIRNEIGSFQKIVSVRYPVQLGSLINLFIITGQNNEVE